MDLGECCWWELRDGMDDEMNIGKKKVVVGGIWEAVRHRFCLAFLSCVFIS